MTGLEIALPYVLPVVANTVKGIATWFTKKHRKDEKLDIKKTMRTTVTGLVTMAAAYMAGLEPTPENLAAVTLQYGFVISFIDATLMKYVWKNGGK